MRFISDALVDFSRQMLAGDVAEGRIVHHPVEDFFAFHPVDAQIFEHAVEDVLEVVDRIRLGPVSGFVCDPRGDLC